MAQWDIPGVGLGLDGAFERQPRSRQASKSQPTPQRVRRQGGNTGGRMEMRTKEEQLVLSWSREVKWGQEIF